MLKKLAQLPPVRSVWVRFGEEVLPRPRYNPETLTVYVKCLEVALIKSQQHQLLRNYCIISPSRFGKSFSRGRSFVSSPYNKDVNVIEKKDFDLKGILDKKSFLGRYHFFLIVMRCGIAHFGRK